MRTVSDFDALQQAQPSPSSGVEEQLPPGRRMASGGPARRLMDWARVVFAFPVALLALVALIVFLMARGGGVNDPDIWWHLRNAQYLLTNLRFPRIDMYSFTVNGHPWVNPEWLAEIPFYLAWRVWGLVGIKLITIVTAESVILGLFYLCYSSSGNLKGSALACGFATFLAVVNFGPRTILFGYGCLVILLIVLERFRRRGRAPLWLLPPLFCLWVNTHGSWFIGLVVFGIIVACGFVEGRWGRVEAVRWSPRQMRDLLLALGGSVAAVFVNPYRARLVLWSVEFPFRMKLGVAHVQEFMSVDFHDARGKLVLILLVGLLIAALTSGYRWQLTELALALFALYSGLTYQRFLFLAAILLAPVIAKLFDFLPPYRPEIDKPILNGLIVAGVLAISVAWFPSSAEINKTLAGGYPVEALSYLKSHKIEGPMFNDYLWGGYLEWNDRAVKTFVDSRVDIFEDAGVIKDYLDTAGIKGSLAVLDKYHIRYVLFSAHQPLVYLLSNNLNWKVRYRSKVAVLFERVRGTPAELAKPTALEMPPRSTGPVAAPN